MVRVRGNSDSEKKKNNKLKKIQKLVNKEIF